jgi:hypothetical protein
MPAWFFASVVIVAVYRLLSARALDGVKTAVTPAKVTVPVTAVACGPATLNDEMLIVAGSIGSLNVAVILLLICTPVSPFAGIVEVTVGAVVASDAVGAISGGLLAHPAKKATSSNTGNHIFENTLHLSIVVPSIGTLTFVKLVSGQPSKSAEIMFAPAFYCGFLSNFHLFSIRQWPFVTLDSLS